jgi:hypothetical protein
MTALKLFFQQRKQKLFSLTMVFLLGFTFHGFSKGPITAATVSTDKTDYLPGQHVSVTGKYWQPGETVKLTFTESPLIHPEQYINTVADASGNIYNADYLIQDHDLGQAFTLTAIGLSSGFNAVTLFTDGESADLDQVRNGSAASPDVTNLWANGAAVESQAHYAEGMSIPYRMRLDNLIDIAGKPSGQHELIISWDITKGGKHAIDYITSYNNIDYPVGTHQAAFGHGPEPIDPLSGTPIVTGMGPASTYPIPAPSSAGSPVTGQPTASFNSLSTLSSGIQTAMTIYNGTIINIVYVSQGSLGTGDNSTTLKITFTTTNSSVVFAWGGHIATESDWGLGQGASGISGSPYHTSLVSLDGSGGNQDRALAAAAVVIPPRVDINGISGGPVVACPETNSLVYNGTILNPNADPVTYSWSLLNNTAGAIIGGSSSGVMAGNIAVVPPLTVVPMGADFTPGGTFNIMLTVSRGVSTDIAYIGSDVYPGANVVITNLQVSAAASPSSINLLISNTSQLSTTVSGGATPYTYSWSADVSGGSLSSHGISDPVFTATAPGIYNYIVTVTENNGCVKTATVKIGVPDPGPTCSVTGLSPVCGTSINTYSGATVTVPEGATFTWTLEANGGGGSTDAVFTSNGLKMLVLNAGASNSISVTAGSQGYRVIVSEVYSNTALNSTCNKDVNVNTIVFTATPTQPKCNGDLGSVLLSTPTGGTGTITFDGTATSGLAEGDYTYTATDANGCKTTQKIHINAAPTAISFTATPTQPKCNGDLGSVLLSTPTGGTGTITFDGTATSGLAEGDYTYTATDANGCKTTQKVHINVAPTAISFTATPTQPKCNGDLGSVLLSTPTGGTGTITFDGTATSGLAEGDYTYTATDANGCKTAQKVHIKAASTAISFTATPTQPKCNGDLGSVLLSTPTGGTGTITFNGTATSGLAEGDYTYTATDANGCNATQKVHINAASTAISFTATPAQPKCFGDKGSVLLSTPTGGTGTITFDGTATSGLAEGDYTYTATDANGCKATQTVHINAAPSQLILTATPSPENCVSKDGSVSLSVNGGTAPYKFKWVNANSLSVTLATTKDLANVAAGTYSVTVTDNNNCTATISATVTRGACVPLYTYTQGYYSSTGTSCTPLGGTKGATALIQYALDNLDKQIGLPIPHNEQIYLGKTGASFTLNYADAANLVKVMPGGGTATKLTANYSFPLPSTILKNGKINNVLLAQTITLGLNINIQGDGLGNFILHTQFLTTMSGAGTACPIVMATCSNGGVVSSLKLSSNAAFLAYLDNKMVSDLYAMASAALGGTLPVIANGTVSYTDINNAIDVINRSFDGGRFFLGYYDVAPTCSTLSASKPRTYSNIFGNAPARTMYQPKIVEEEKVTTLSATAYPNPFTDRVKFSIVSPVSGKASLDVYNMMGQKIKTVYNGYLFANRTQVIDYSIPSSVKGALIYTLRVGDKQVNGKVVQMK